MKRYETVLASFNQTIALKPDSAEAYYNRGLHMLIQGDMTEAEGMFLKALALKPFFPAALSSLANI